MFSLENLRAVDRTSPDRPALESFVARAFRDRHGARVHNFLPTLLGLHRPATGDLCGVAGYRLAQEGPLYLEQYLDGPVESALAERLGRPVGRDGIVEIGNFASDNCRIARRFAALLPDHFLSLGQTWAVFTATDMIRSIVASLGATLVELHRAEPARVAASGDDWGAYWRTDPRVMAAYVPAARDLCLARKFRH